MLFRLVLPFLLGFMLISYSSFASTIIPFTNLGEMAKGSPIVVLATAQENYEIEFNGATRFRTSFSIDKLIKGDLPNDFSVQNMKLRNGALNRIVYGDIEFEERKTYLLYLEDRGDFYQTTMLSHGVFMQFENDGEKLLSPVKGGLNFFKLSRPDGRHVEHFKVYRSEALIQLLEAVVQGSQTWNSKLASTDYLPSQWQFSTRVEPAHCTFIGDPIPYARWTDFPGTALPVHYSASGDSGCPSANAKVQGTITALNTNYTGLNMSDGGTHSFVPSCSGGDGATGSEFTSWVSTNLGGTRHVVVQYDDPCSEITDLTGCSGTLAVGGLYWFSSTHVYDGMNWNPAAYGYVVVNNGTGACQCPSTDYDIMMIHEITHSLGIGHIAAADGTANMNPSCCNSPSALDIACLDYTYAPVVLPIELHSFSAELVNKSTELEWTTLSESKNDLFTIERSTDGIHFAEIGTVAGAGNSSELKNYKFLDRNPNYGSNYYRLLQTDFDRETSIIGETILVEYIESGILELKPNPVRADKMQLTHMSETVVAKLDVQIFDINGQSYGIQQFENLIGKNELSINVNQLHGGVYILQVQDGSTTRSLRFIKVD